MKEHYHKRKAKTDNGKDSRKICEICGSFLDTVNKCPSCD